ncbi:hypothetical protein [Salinicoccus halodurans]|uniref:Uncharacterized protein n=1 Tax=Salinicoccus halodurans TaxID=407035 RepID=A0A0F7HLN4_9STAP|nr:hypothetical protein [Salinicoccus halodurans]AKG74528.1 hypothetical protein AAT16_10215 [Salinicoccus halodurans]SFK90195.1 hypothetical protein SAMN05216235_2415 [Salinicoccus halodurans]
MKNVLIVILLIAFGAGLYVNFGMSQNIDQSDIISESTEGETEENTEDDASQTSDEDGNSGNPATSGENLTFSQEPLQERYTQAVENNEALIIDVLLPSYYTDGFIETLAGQFGTDNIQFNRIDIDTNTVDLTELTVSENSDAVIMDALQIRDYNDEVLPERNVDNLTNAYMNIYNSDKIVYILGNPNVHEHENLADILAEDQASLVENDYFYIDNQDVSVDGEFYDYEADTLTPETESRIAESIYGYMVE